MFRRGIGKQDGYELGGVRARVEPTADKVRFPEDAASLALFLVPFEPAMIYLRADNQQEVGSVYLPLAPERPITVRRGVMLIRILIDLSDDASS